jgi:Family of unknown function (DUF5995)
MSSRNSLIVPPAFESVEDAVNGLAELESAFTDRHDRRGVFVTAYLVITRIIQQWIDRGEFLENDMVAGYAVAFANAYRQALADYQAGERRAVPTAWRQAFDASGTNSVSIIQDLLLGINAHINHDLPHAVLDGGFNVHCDRCYRDHTRINDALRAATPLVRARIAARYQRGLFITNWLWGRRIDHLVANSFERARENSWTLAKALDLAHCPAETARVRRMIDDRAALAGHAILAHRYQPGRCLAAVYELDRGTGPTLHPSLWRPLFAYS